MATNLQSILQELTAQPSTQHPYLSIYLDWSTDGSGKRPALRALEQELDQIAAGLGERGVDVESFNTDRQRIMTYLDDEAPKDAQGLAIFACDAEDVWVPVPLHVPVETEVVEDRYPHLFRLAQISDDHETYAVVLVDSQESRILVVALNEPRQAATTEASEEIRRFDAGGPGQSILQRRTENLIKAHTKDIAEHLGKIVKRYGIEHVIIAGNDSIKGMVLSTLPDTLKAKLVDYIHLDIAGSLTEIMAATDPMMREVERKQEADDVARLEDQMATKGGLGTAGVAETALALGKGQVQTLLMLQSFAGAGGECPNCGMLRAGQRANCPYDGAELQPVELREVFTARALQQGSAIQIVEASDYLDQHGGVGALLRYRDDQQEQTV